MHRSVRPLGAALAAAALAAGCGGSGGTAAGPPTTAAASRPVPAPTTTAPTPPAPTPPAPTPTAPTPTAPTPTAPTPTAPTANGATPAPDWLGTRVLPTDAAGYGIATGTPPELVDRRIVTVDELPPPADGAFHARVRTAPADVARRSTWSARCPVPLADLRYLTVSFRGFDGRAHTGELLVHRDAADAMVTVFRRLFAAGHPIERMRISTVAERDAPPTGDDNTTSAFVCRLTVGGTGWSQHAYGRAVDVDPFQNPYLRGKLVLPELARAYLDRGRVLPGVITAGGPVVAAFRSVGWTWGGGWTSPKDYMHFSANGH